MKRQLTLLIFLISFGCGKQINELQDIIGLDIKSKSFQAFLSKLEVAPEISRYDDSYFYVFKTKGIDINFNNSNTVKAVFLFTEGADEHKQYQGIIPYDIQFTDTRKDIEQKLGPPNMNGGNGVLNFYSSWNKKGIKLSISYKTTDQKDMNNRIRDITLSKWSN